MQYVCIFFEAQKGTSSVILQMLSTFVFERSPLTRISDPFKSRLAGLHVPGIQLLLPTHYLGDYNHIPSSLAFYVGVATQTQVLMMFGIEVDKWNKVSMVYINQYFIICENKYQSKFIYSPRNSIILNAIFWRAMKCLKITCLSKIYLKYMTLVLYLIWQQV